MEGEMQDDSNMVIQLSALGAICWKMFCNSFSHHPYLSMAFHALLQFGHKDEIGRIYTGQCQEYNFLDKNNC